MQNIINFIQKILFINEPIPNSIGLSQFKSKPIEPKQPVKKEIKKEVKLSDLMRRS